MNIRNFTGKVVLFSPWTPDPNTSIAKRMATDRDFKKIFYYKDLFASNLLKIDGLVNAVVFKDDSWSPQAGHSISYYAKGDIQKMNRNQKQNYQKKVD